MILSSVDAGGAGRARTKTPRPSPAGFPIFLKAWRRLIRRGGKSENPPNGGFFGFQRAARISHVAIIEAVGTDVNETLTAIHAVETSPR